MTDRQLFLGGYIPFPAGISPGSRRHPDSGGDRLGRGFLHETARLLEGAGLGLAIIRETVSYRDGFGRHLPRVRPARDAAPAAAGRGRHR